MKSLNLAVIVTSVMVAVSGMAQAESANTANQNLSKRPYQAPLENNAYKADDQWEGATLRTDEALDENGVAVKKPNKHNQLKLNSLGKRPYMD